VGRLIEGRHNNEEPGRKMRKAGCWILFLGIESTLQKILDWIGKRITIEQIRRAVKTIKRAGIQVLGSFIIGFPEETVNQ